MAEDGRNISSGIGQGGAQVLKGGISPLWAKAAEAKARKSASQDSSGDLFKDLKSLNNLEIFHRDVPRFQQHSKEIYDLAHKNIDAIKRGDSNALMEIKTKIADIQNEAALSKSLRDQHKQAGMALLGGEYTPESVQYYQDIEDPTKVDYSNPATAYQEDLTRYQKKQKPFDYYEEIKKVAGGLRQDVNSTPIKMDLGGGVSGYQTREEVSQEMSDKTAADLYNFNPTFKEIQPDFNKFKQDFRNYTKTQAGTSIVRPSEAEKSNIVKKEEFGSVPINIGKPNESGEIIQTNVTLDNAYNVPEEDVTITYSDRTRSIKNNSRLTKGKSTPGKVDVISTVLIDKEGEVMSDDQIEYLKKSGIFQKGIKSGELKYEPMVFMTTKTGESISQPLSDAQESIRKKKTEDGKSLFQKYNEEAAIKNKEALSENKKAPHGDIVSQGGKKYKWNGTEYKEIK